MTIYVDEREEIQRWIDQFRLNHNEAYQADKAEIYQAIIEVAQEHEDEVLDLLNEDEA